ncbi:MAG TPA: phytanoyl-CoA dioxygenase family protein [Candidatus Baltobacteraceae bacterium]|nr:phytanoyl-CoA dioxygenase family protein [Candidatus Baltobacteraceae bacterium]
MRVLTSAQRTQFEEDGYLVVDGVLDPGQDLAPVLAEYEEVLNGIAASLLSAGTIRSEYPGLPFAERLIRICIESGRNFPQEFDISLPQTGVSHDTPIHVGPAVFRLLSAPRLLDLAEDILGPEIYSNPVQHIRMKLPQRAVATSGPYNGLVSQIPWHQDNGVILPEADVSHILTVWFPLKEATVANGCLQVIPGSHHNDLIAHCPAEKGVGIPDSLLPKRAPVALPMKPGSVLLMTSRTVHGSLENTTEDEVRMSFDLRYQPIGEPTGRPAFPGFVARSAAHPESVLTDPAAWAKLWHETRARMAEESNPAFNRWQAGVGVCA